MPTPAPGAPIAFQLEPFPGDRRPSALSITGDAHRRQDRLTLRYRLSGALPELLLPQPQTSRRRCDDLWQSTCLECFLARAGDAGYWEVNLAPAGDWNLYRLEGYRQELRPEPSCQEAPQLERRDEQDAVELTMRLRLPAALLDAPVLELGITAVIATRSGALSYWALRHPGEQADFHRREAFSLRL